MIRYFPMRRRYEGGFQPCRSFISPIGGCWIKPRIPDLTRSRVGRSVDWINFIAERENSMSIKRILSVAYGRLFFMPFSRFHLRMLTAPFFRQAARRGSWQARLRFPRPSRERCAAFHRRCAALRQRRRVRAYCVGYAPRTCSIIAVRSFGASWKK